MLSDLQVNGKMRGTIDVAKDIAQDAALEQARALESVARHIEGKEIKKIIFVPGKIMNLIAK